MWAAFHYLSHLNIFLSYLFFIVFLFQFAMKTHAQKAIFRKVKGLRIQNKYAWTESTDWYKLNSVFTFILYVKK